MAIQWFPGHMAKARRQVVEKLNMIDVVMELLDARLPHSSQNPMLDEILQDKPKLILLNKADLADEHKTKQWVEHYKLQGIQALPIDAQSGKGIKMIPEKCAQLAHEMISKRQKKGMQDRAVRALIVGIPNVGKSSLINRLANRHVAKTGDRPGITKAQQWIKVGHVLELLDTPGILWPKFDDQIYGFRLAVSGAIRDDILPLDDVALFAIEFLQSQYKGRVQERYQLQDSIFSIQDDTNPDQNEMDEQTQYGSPHGFVHVLEAIGQKRGCLIRGGQIDFDKVCEILLYELRAGLLGRITFETPADIG